MQRIKAVGLEQSSGKTKELIEKVENQLGMIPVMLTTLANSPVALEAYIHFWDALDRGILPADLRQKIALCVAEFNGADYCVSARCAMGKCTGLTDEEIQDSRLGQSPDRKTEAVLRFVRKVLDSKGNVSSDEIKRLKNLGFTDEAITEIIANGVFVLFSNYFNNVAGTVIDFPKAKKLEDH
ncbi:MAG: alkyl hydroperoxide reductase AhpD [Nitrospinaceae bacterium]|nr:MAG: alkyl hydroperoxide reductase AhpD [Nitrospinaceae bacterium]